MFLFHPFLVCKLGTYNGHPMAGSFIPSGQSLPISAINRYVYGGSFQLSLPYDGGDVLPPGRIVDLNISNFDSKNSSAVLTWTAPRDNYNVSDNLGEQEIPSPNVKSYLIF
jgi:hypothetical protein